MVLYRPIPVNSDLAVRVVYRNEESYSSVRVLARQESKLALRVGIPMGCQGALIMISDGLAAA